MQSQNYSQLFAEMNALKEKFQESQTENDRQKVESISTELVNCEQGDGDAGRMVKDDDDDTDKISDATCYEPAADSFLTAGVVYFESLSFQYFGSKF